MLRLRLLVLLTGILLFAGCSPSGLNVNNGTNNDLFTLTINAGANGTVSVSEAGPYTRNQIVQLTANPDLGFQVGSWSGTMNDGAATLTNNVRMDRDRTVSVTFAAAIILSGNVTFTSIPATGAGLDYGSSADLPIRGAIIQIIDQNTSVVYSQGNLDNNGDYSLSAPANTDIRIIVQAALGTPGDPHSLVVDNTDSESLYSLFLDMTTGVADTPGVDFNADTIWGGSDYTTRAGAPFAILDVVYEAEQMVLAADATAIFPQLTINWSALNVPVSGDISAGQIGTSFYSGVDRALYILGAEDIDTDEYDRAIIAHEWAHYFEHQFSRSDSIGGPHTDGDILDPSVAMSEGFATALSGIIRGTNTYFDTAGTNQGSTAVNVDLEADATNDADVFIGDPLNRLLDGYWSEGSVSEVLYDIMDATDDGADDISLGFAAIYDAMTSDYKDTPAFTSILTFLYHLKLQQAVSATSIENIANAENISTSTEFETANTAEGYRMYTPLTVGALVTQDVDANNLTTSDVYENIGTVNDNKLMHRRFFNMTEPAGVYKITIDPTEVDEVMLIHFNDGQSFQAGAAGADLIFEYDHGGDDFTFAVGTLGSAGAFTIEVAFTPAGAG